MAEKILLVDDDPNVLSGFQRQLRKDFDVITAEDGALGLEAIDAQGPFAVIVSDLRMPGMDGIQFLSRARELAPDSVRMMLTGHADLEVAVEAVNEGNVFRFLTKPCSLSTLSRALEAGVHLYRLVMAERELLQQTLKGSVKVITDILSLLSPIAFGRVSRVRRMMGKLAEQLSPEQTWEFELAGMLSQAGCITMPVESVENIYRNKPVSALEQHMFERHPQIGHDLVANIPRLESIAEIIAYQSKHHDGGGVPLDERKGEDIPLGARALHAALDFDTLVSSGRDLEEALEEMRERSGWYDPNVLQSLASIVQSEGKSSLRAVKINDLASGMVLAEDVTTTDGFIVIAKGLEITPSLKTRLENFNETIGVREPVRVLVPKPASHSVSDAQH